MRLATRGGGRILWEAEQVLWRWSEFKQVLKVKPGSCVGVTLAVCPELSEQAGQHMVSWQGLGACERRCSHGRAGAQGQRSPGGKRIGRVALVLVTGLDYCCRVKRPALSTSARGRVRIQPAGLSCGLGKDTPPAQGTAVFR